MRIGPFSLKAPYIEEHPGPPLSHMMSGGVGVSGGTCIPKPIEDIRVSFTNEICPSLKLFIEELGDCDSEDTQQHLYI